MERINTSMDNQGSNNNYNNGNSNGGNNGDGGKGNHNGQILMAFILISLIALFIMSLVTNQFNQMSTQEVSYSEFLDMVNGTGKWEGRSVKSVEIGSYQIDITLDSDEKTPYEVTYYCGRVADDELIPLLKEKGVDISGVIPDNTSTWIYSILSHLIPLVLIWVVLGVVMRRMGGGAMGVGKSNAKVYVEKQTGVTFKDVAGQDEAKESLQDPLLKLAPELSPGHQRRQVEEVDLFIPQLEGHIVLPKHKKIIISVKDADKQEVVPLAQRFEKLGYEVYATRSTADVLRQNGVDAIKVNKIHQEAPTVMDLLLEHKIDIVIDTPTQGRDKNRDGFLIRRTSIETGVNCFTSLDTVDALLTSLESNAKENLTLVDIATI